MERFVFWDLPIHNYSQEQIVNLSDAELVDHLNNDSDWDLDLLRELLWRAHRDDPGYTFTAEGKDSIRELQAAAEKLGQHLLYN